VGARITPGGTAAIHPVDTIRIPNKSRATRRKLQDGDQPSRRSLTIRLCDEKAPRRGRAAPKKRTKEPNSPSPNGRRFHPRDDGGPGSRLPAVGPERSPTSPSWAVFRPNEAKPVAAIESVVPKDLTSRNPTQNRARTNPISATAERRSRPRRAGADGERTRGRGSVGPTGERMVFQANKPNRTDRRIGRTGKTVGTGLSPETTRFRRERSQFANRRNTLIQPGFRLSQWAVARRRTNPIPGAAGRGLRRADRAWFRSASGRLSARTEPNRSRLPGEFACPQSAVRFTIPGEGGRAARW